LCGAGGARRERCREVVVKVPVEAETTPNEVKIAVPACKVPVPACTPAELVHVPKVPVLPCPMIPPRQ
jgi:hypothetical protein